MVNGNKCFTEYHFIIFFTFTFIYIVFKNIESKQQFLNRLIRTSSNFDNISENIGKRE